MEELELKYKTIQECINTLKKLSAEHPAEARPALVGQGSTIAEMEQLANLYASFYETLELLAQETAQYLNFMVSDFKGADKKMPQVQF